jgi:hypothetical protein
MHTRWALAEGPRRHRGPAFLAAKQARADETHVAPVNALARETPRRPG